MESGNIDIPPMDSCLLRGILTKKNSVANPSKILVPKTDCHPPTAGPGDSPSPLSVPKLPSGCTSFTGF